MPADTTTPIAPGPFRRMWNWLPDRVDRRVVVAAWANLVMQIVIVGTGGLVRLTGSGLGCPEWPYCTGDSLVPTQAMGIHGLIEFGNRTLTGVLVIVALVAFLFVVRIGRRDLTVLALSVGIGIIVQAVVGGIIVLLKLPPSVVGIHFLISATLVVLATGLVCRVHAQPGPRVRAVPAWYAVTVRVTGAVVAVTVAIGILLTGSGPHAGDDIAARNGLDPILWQHVHSWPAYATFALTVVLFAGSWRTAPALRLRLWTGLLLAVELVQIGVGLWQARTGLPILLVNIHMVLAVLVVSAMTAVVMHITAPAPTIADPALDPSEQTAGSLS
ncbi:COX15/CtaA family protein [Microbacterium deminutum]|uniref:COX15/CtaA family protein n=1 Tax=Microbacterium deminutum TaxID=344164 RepID=A0ABP5BNZ3_9MICO